MNTHEGYSKTTLDNTQILLAGGGHKPFDDFIGSIQYSSTSKTLQYRNPYSDPQNPPSWLNIVTLGARAFDDTAYVTVVGNGTGSHINQLYYTKNGSNNYFTVNYASTSDFLLKRSTAKESGGVQFIVGQIATATNPTNDKAYKGSSKDFRVLSFPSGGTAINNTGASNESANISIFRIAWGTSYWHDLHFSPNVNSIYHRTVQSDTANDWRILVETDGNKGDSTTPVYVEDGLVKECTSYADANVNCATKASLDNDGNAFKSYYLRKVSVPNNTTNDFNTFENMTLTGRGDPTTGASLSHAPWTGSGPAGGYGVLTYLWSGYGMQMAWGYHDNHIYIRNKYYNNGASWSDSWSTVALTSDLSGFLTSQDHYKTSITAGTAGTSNATSGNTLAVPYVTVNANGHVTGYGTHTHTISGFLTTLDHYKTSITAGTAGTSSDTSGATLAVPYVSMNANGHVTGYGTHTHSVTAVVGSYTSNGGQQNPNYFGTNRVGFLMMNTTVNNNSLYKDWMIMDCYGGNDVGGGVAIGVNRQSLGAYIMRSAAARTSWAESAELIGTHNYTTYCATSGHDHDSVYVKKSGDTMTGSLTISTANWANQLILNRTSASSTWGPSILFQYDGTINGTLTMTSNQLYIGDNGNNRYKAWHEGNDGSGSGLDADTLDGYHFSDLESRYVNTTGDIMTGGILMSSMEASGKRWMYGVTRNSGFKYDYAGNESFIISSGTYSLSSISFYTSNRLSMNDSTGQWNSVTPDMRIKGTRVSINSDINTSYQLYVNGSTYSTGYYRANSSDSYVLLGGGGHKLITDLISSGTTGCLAYYSTSTKISSANSLKYTSDPGYLTVGDEAWISGNCMGFIDGMNIRFYDDSDDADPTDFPYIHENISLFSGGYATIFDSYQPIVINNDVRLVDPANYGWQSLYANNGTFYGTLSASTGTFIGTLSALNNKFYVNSSGAFWTSDIRAKKDIHQITKEEVDKLFSTPDGYLKGFTFKDGDIKSFGVIAQEIIEYCPECIDEGELLHVNYDVALSKIMAGMYLKIKELEKEIEILRNR